MLNKKCIFLLFIAISLIVIPACATGRVLPPETPSAISPPQPANTSQSISPSIAAQASPKQPGITSITPSTTNTPSLPDYKALIWPIETWQLDTNLSYGPESIWGNALVGIEPYRRYGFFTSDIGNQRIVVYDLDTRKQIKSFDPPYGMIMDAPSIYDNKIVFADVAMSQEEHRSRSASSSNLPLPNYDIFLFDLQTNQMQQLTHEEHAQMRPKIYGDTVVWLDARNKQPGQGGFDIYALDLKTTQETRITPDSAAEGLNDNQLAISGNLVVWTDIRNVDKSLRWGGTNDPTYNVDIYAYDLIEKQEYRVTTSLNNDRCLNVDNGKITWLRQITFEKADIYVYDFESRRETLVSHDGYKGFAPSIQDERIVWENTAIRKTSESASALVAEGTIALFDLETKMETLLKPIETYTFFSQPVIHGSHVVYRDDSKLESPVFITVLSNTPSPAPPTTSTPPAGNGVKPPISYIPVDPGTGPISFSNMSSEIITLDGWQLENPFPQANKLEAVWASSLSDIFAAGSFGTILHYDGTSWSMMKSGTTSWLRDIWGSSPEDIFAVGSDRTILHYNGETWNRMNSGSQQWPNAVWGCSSSDVFVVGTGGAIIHYDGSAWSPMDSGTDTELNSIWGSSSNDVFAVGKEGVILHFDGKVWSRMESSSARDLLDIWGSSASDIFAVGLGGTILHFDGNTWSKMASGTTENIFSVSGSSPSNVFAVGMGNKILHYDGKTWEFMSCSTDNYLTSVCAYSDSGAVAVGQNGIIVRYDDNVWRSMSNGYTIERLNDVWGSSATDVYAVGGGSTSTGLIGTILHYDGKDWSHMGQIDHNTLSGIWGISSSDVFAVGMGGLILHYDGSSWKAMQSNTSKDLTDIWGSSASDIFTVGVEGTIIHYDGSNWTEMDTKLPDFKYTFTSIWGTSSKDVFAVGDKGTILHYDGSNWKTMNSSTTSWLFSIWGTSPSSVFATGDVGIILHYDGARWTRLNTGITNFITDIWGSSPSDIYAIGSEGLILHYDGSSWEKMNVGTLGTPGSIWGDSADNIYAVGSGGLILHYTGK